MGIEEDGVGPEMGSAAFNGGIDAFFCIGEAPAFIFEDLWRGVWCDNIVTFRLECIDDISSGVLIAYNPVSL